MTLISVQSDEDRYINKYKKIFCTPQHVKTAEHFIQLQPPFTKQP